MQNKTHKGHDGSMMRPYLRQPWAAGLGDARLPFVEDLSNALDDKYLHDVHVGRGMRG